MKTKEERATRQRAAPSRGRAFFDSPLSSLISRPLSFLSALILKIGDKWKILRLRLIHRSSHQQGESKAQGGND